MTTSMRLAAGGILIAGVTAYLAYSAASSEWQYYLTVDECLAPADALQEVRIRVSGRIAADSLEIAADRTEATFLLAGASGQLQVRCSGPLPDNLAEDRDVVVEGRLDGHRRFQGTRVLTRCASKYEAASQVAGGRRQQTRYR